VEDGIRTFVSFVISDLDALGIGKVGSDFSFTMKVCLLLVGSLGERQLDSTRVDGSDHAPGLLGEGGSSFRSVSA